MKMGRKTRSTKIRERIDLLSKKPTRETERAKYIRAYNSPRYSAGIPRMNEAISDLRSLSVQGSLLDVGCGRGEFLKLAEGNGFDPCKGTEIVPSLIDGKRVVFGEAHNLPFSCGSFDMVTAWDVMEHLIPGDDEDLCREMERVAKKCILLGVNNRKAYFRGRQLHINRRPYEEWDDLLRKWFNGEVTWLKGKRVSETWTVKL